MGSDGGDHDNSHDDSKRDEPIPELRALTVDPSAGFTQRLRRRIERRETSVYLFGFFWHLPAVVLLAFLEMVFALLGSDRSDGGGVK